jgi:hypothetical protein
MGLDTKTYLLTDRQSQCDFDLVKSDVRNITQGEARHRKCKMHKLSGGQAYDRSSD